MVEEMSVGTSREAGMANIGNMNRNWKFHQQMHRRARELARMADPLAGLRPVLGPSYLTPAWAPYTNPSPCSGPNTSRPTAPGDATRQRPPTSS